MSVDKIWVLAEVADGAPITTSLELLSQARALAGTVEAVAWGDTTASVAGTLGEYGATTVYDVGDLGGSLPGAPVAAAIAAAVSAGGRSRRHPLPGHLRRPGHRRPPLGQARPSRPDQRRRPDRRRRGADHPARHLRRQPDGLGPVHRRRPGDLRHPGQVVRGRTIRRRTGRGGRHSGPRHRRHRRREDRGPPRRGADRTQARRGRRGGLRWPGSRREGPVRAHRGTGHAAPWGGGGQSGHRRCRMGSLFAPGGADRQDGEAHRVHRLRASPAPPSTSWG